VEGEQRVFGRLHGSGLVVLVLAQEQEVFAELVLGERSRVTLEMLGQLADIADVLLLGGRRVVLEFDKLLELREGGIVDLHSGRRTPSDEEPLPTKRAMHINRQP